MRIYLAGMESAESEEMFKHGFIKNAFFSYYYLRQDNIRDGNRLKQGRRSIKNIIIDSGAHTFFSEDEEISSASVHRKKTKTKENPEEFFQKYQQWVLKYFNYFDYFVELDIGEIVGQETVLRWREELKKAGLYKKCITCYHPKSMTFQDYLDTIADSQSKYVALEGDRSDRERLPYLKLIKAAYDKGVKVHGFAMTKNTVYEQFPFFSIDSSSWKSAIQYGAGKVVTSQGIQGIRFRDIDILKVRSPYASEALSAKKKNQRIAMQLLAVDAYNKLEIYYSDLWKKRGINWDLIEK